MERFLRKLIEKRYIPRLFKNFIKDFLTYSLVGKTMQISFTAIILIACFGLLANNICYAFIFAVLWVLYEINPK